MGSCTGTRRSAANPRPSHLPQLLEEKLYYVTWKADGTRYMVVLMQDGVYLINRSFEVRRVQMHFPKHFNPKTGESKGPHHMTVLVR